MATYVPPKKNTAFIIYIGLPDYALGGLMKSTPTLAAGDAKVSIDGGALANLTTLPAVTPAASKMVKVSLSAAEMNGDNITVVISDQTSPPEWCDVIINLATVARQIEDLAYPATSGRSIVVDAAGLVDANMVKAGPTGSGTAQTAGDIFARLGAPAGASMSADIAAIKGDTATAVTQTTAANIRAALGLATANLDTQLATIAAYIDTEVATIVTQTTAASIRTALGLASANLDTQLSTIAAYIDTEVAAIKAKTDSLTFTVAGTLDVNVTNWKGTTAPAMTGDAYARLGAPSGASVSADILSLLQAEIIRSNTAQAGSASSITLDAGASATDSLYKDETVIITSGTGAGQSRIISSYVGATKVASVTPNWITAPDATSVFMVLAANGLGDLRLISGAALATTSAQIGVNVVNVGGTAQTAGDIIGRLGTPAGASISVDVAAIKSDTATAVSQTAAAAIRADVGLASANLDTQLSTIASYVDTEIGTLQTTATAIKAKTDNLPAAPAAVSDIPTANQNADALLDRADGVETGFTFRQSLRLYNSVLLGKVSGAGTGTEVFRDLADTKARITATVDANGNRSAITRDAT